MALMSFIFMFVVGILSNGFYLLPGTDEDVLLELMSFISFFGSVLFLLEGRKVLSGWYLAIPFCISLFLLVNFCHLRPDRVADRAALTNIKPIPKLEIIF
ncbi:hypothetical protein [Methanosarcina mazei]|nr:hypothetical protein [Methanosarcina mazei]